MLCLIIIIILQCQKGFLHLTGSQPMLQTSNKRRRKITKVIIDYHILPVRSRCCDCYKGPREIRLCVYNVKIMPNLDSGEVLIKAYVSELVDELFRSPIKGALLKIVLNQRPGCGPHFCGQRFSREELESTQRLNPKPLSD